MLRRKAMSEIKSRTVTQEFDEKGNLVSSDVYEEFYPEKPESKITFFRDMSVPTLKPETADKYAEKSVLRGFRVSGNVEPLYLLLFGTAFLPAVSATLTL
jgi:hypothetical protein